MKSTKSGEYMHTYPSLMRGNKGLIILFTNPEVGVVMHAGDSAWRVGSYSDDWIMANFSYYNGTITLSN